MCDFSCLTARFSCKCCNFCYSKLHIGYVCASVCVCVHVCISMMYTGALMHGWKSEKNAEGWSLLSSFLETEYLHYYCLYQVNCPVSMHELSWPHLPSHNRTLWLQIHNTCWTWTLGFNVNPSTYTASTLAPESSPPS